MTFALITDEFSVSGELTEQDFTTLNKLGVSMLINARPDNENDGQKNDEDFKILCEAHGIEYVHVPVKPGQYSQNDIEKVANAFNAASGKVHGLCKTGARAAHLWALSQKEAKCFDELQKKAQAQGYDLTMIKNHFE